MEHRYLVFPTDRNPWAALGKALSSYNSLFETFTHLENAEAHLEALREAHEGVSFSIASFTLRVGNGVS